MVKAWSLKTFDAKDASSNEGAGKVEAVVKTYDVKYSWTGMYSNKIDCKLVFTARLVIPDDLYAQCGIWDRPMREIIDHVVEAQRMATVHMHGDPWPWRVAWAEEARKLAESLVAAIKALTGVELGLDDWVITHRADDFIIDIRHNERKQERV